MKCLSIKQPHADRIMSGQKIYEIRSWKTKYRGPLLICASGKHDRRYPEAKSLSLGVSVAKCNLVDVVEFTPKMAKGACIDWMPGLYAWVIEDAQPVKQIPVKGQLGLFPVPKPLRGLAV